jgi:two-component system sensor histidine kinase/response regulator
MSNMIVHDFKNPLTAIIGASDLLATTMTDAEDKHAVQMISNEARRLNALSNDLLILAKAEGGNLILNRTMIDVNQLAHRVVESSGIISRPRGVQVIPTLAANSREMPLDASLFQRVLENLVSNAIKFSPRDSRVDLKVDYPQAALRIQVQDQGPGVAEEHRDRIFEKFEIVALNRRDVPQVGLGLAFCKMVVEAHGGQITVTDNQPSGASFVIELPDSI